MPAGFHVASAWVDIHAEDAGLRGEIQRAIQGAVAGQDGKVKLDVDASALRAKVESAVKSASAGAKGEVKLDLDAGSLRGKIESAIKGAAAGAKAKVGIELDEAGLRSRVSAAVRAAGAGQRVRVGVDVDRGTLDRAQGALRRFADDNNRIMGGGRGGFLGRRSGLGNLSYGAVLAGLSMLEPALGALIAPMKTLGIASAVLVPAFLGTATAAAALIVGTRGVGTAFQASGKDATAYGAALNNLAPAAQDFVRQGVAMKEGLTGLRLNTQQALFQGLGAELTKMGSTALPVVTAGLTGMAQILNTSMKGAMQTIGNLSQNGTLGAMFGGLATAFRPLQNIPGQMIQMLSQISVAASPLLTRITTGIGNAFSGMTKGLDAMFKSGMLQANIDKAGASIGRFFTNFKQNEAVQDFMTNLRTQGPAAAQNLQKIGEAGLTLLNSSSTIGSALLKVGGAAAGIINAVPTGVLTPIMATVGAFSLLRRAEPGIVKAQGAIQRLGQSLGLLAPVAAPTTRAATAVTSLGAAARGTGTALASGALTATAIRQQAAAMSTTAVATRAAGTGFKAAAAGALATAVSTKGLTTGLGVLAAGFIGSGLLEWSAGLGQKAIPTTKQLNTQLIDMASKGQISAKSLQSISSGWVNIGSALKTVLDPSMGQRIANILEMPDGKNSDLNRSRDMIKGFDGALAEMVNSGLGDQAARIFSNIGEVAKSSGVPVSKLGGQFKQYTEAVKNQVAAERIAAMTMGTYGQEAVATQKFIAANKGEVQGLANSYNALGRMNAGAIGAQVQYNAAASQAAAAAKENGKALTMTGGVLNTTTPKAQAAAQGMLQMAEAAKVSSEAWVGKNDYAQAARGIDQARAAITKLGIAQGLTASQAKEFTNQILPNNTAKMWSQDIAQTAKSFQTLGAAMAKAPSTQKLFNFDKSQIAAASTFRTAMEKVGATVKTMDNGNIQIKVDTADAASKVKSLQTVFQGLAKGTKSIKLPAADIGKVTDALKATGMDVKKIGDMKFKITAEDGASIIIDGIKNKLDGLGKGAAGKLPAIMGGNTKEGLKVAEEHAKRLDDSFKEIPKSAGKTPPIVNKIGDAVDKAGKSGIGLKKGFEGLAPELQKYEKQFPNLAKDLEKMRLTGGGIGSMFRGMGSAIGDTPDKFKDIGTALDKVKGAKDVQVQVQISGTEQIDKLKALNDVKAKNIQVQVNISGTEDIEKLKALNEVNAKAINVQVNISGTEDIDKLKALNDVADTSIIVQVSISGTEDIDKLKALNEVNNKSVQVQVNISGTEDIEKLKELNNVNNKSVQVQVSISGTEDIEKLQALNNVNNKSVNVQVSISGTEQIDKLKALNEVNNKSVSVSVSISGTEQIDKLKALNEVNNKSVMVSVNISGTEQIDKLKALNEVNNKSVSVTVSISGTEQIDKLKALNEVNNKSVTVTVSVTGADQIEKLKGLNEVNAKNISVNVSISGAQDIDKLKDLNNLPSSKSVTITVNANAGQATQLKSALDGIPSSKTVTVTVSANAGPINQVKSAIQSIQNKTVTVTVSANAGPVNQVKSAIQSIQNKTVTVTVSANAGQVNALKSAIAGITSKSVTVTATASPAQVNALKAAINSVQGKSVTVTAVVNGLGEVQALIAAIAAVQSKTVTVTVNTVKTGSAAGGGHMTTQSLAPGFAAGGRSYIGGGGVHGIGTATSDSIFARLSNGEFVIRASMVKKYGPEMLAAINHGVFNPNGIDALVNGALKRFPGFHRGGYTSSSSSTYGVGGSEKDEAAYGNWGDQFSTGITYPVWTPGTGTTSGNVSLSQLYRGANNAAVLMVQKALKEIYPDFDYSSGPGIFGPRTQQYYSMWQRSLGYRGSDANGIPGIASLTALANRTGEFSVKNSQAIISYIIQWGDTLTSIARKFGTSVDELVRLNNIRNPDLIYAGNRLKIPSMGGSSTPPPAVIPGTLPGQWNYLAPPSFSKLKRRQDKTGSEDDVEYKDVAEVESAHQLAGLTTFDANHFFGNLTGTNQAALSNKISEATDLKSLTSVLDEMRTITTKAFAYGSSRDSLNSYLAQGGKIEIQYMKNLEEVNKSLEDAKSKNDELKSSYKQLNEQIQQNIQEFASLVKTGKAGASTTTMLRQLTKDAGRVTEFQTGMDSLRARGLNDVSLAQIANAGPVDGLRTIKSLLSATPQQIAQINALQAQVNTVANKAGVTAADSMYQAGMAASQGLVDGLTANKAQIENAMKLIAEAMQTAIKQALGIKSPSTVMHQNGIWTIQGLIQGLQSQGKTVPEIIKAIAAQIETNGKANLGQAISGAINGTTTAASGTSVSSSSTGGDLVINGGVHVRIDGANLGDLKDPEECRKVAKQLGQYIVEEIRDINRKRS